jgi:hypothetical protein
MIIYGIIFWGFLPFVAFAYLDPGSFNYIVQIILGVMVGGLYALRGFWKNIKLFFARIFHKEKEEQ